MASAPVTHDQIQEAPHHSPFDPRQYVDITVGIASFSAPPFPFHIRPPSDSQSPLQIKEEPTTENEVVNRTVLPPKLPVTTPAARTPSHLSVGHLESPNVDEIKTLPKVQALRKPKTRENNIMMDAASSYDDEEEIEWPKSGPKMVARMANESAAAPIRSTPDNSNLRQVNADEGRKKTADLRLRSIQATPAAKEQGSEDMKSDESERHVSRLNGKVSGSGGDLGGEPSRENAEDSVSERPTPIKVTRKRKKMTVPPPPRPVRSRRITRSVRKKLDSREVIVIDDDSDDEQAKVTKSRKSKRASTGKRKSIHHRSADVLLSEPPTPKRRQPSTERTTAPRTPSDCGDDSGPVINCAAPNASASGASNCAVAGNEKRREGVENGRGDGGKVRSQSHQDRELEICKEGNILERKNLVLAAIKCLDPGDEKTSCFTAYGAVNVHRKSGTDCGLESNVIEQEAQDVENEKERLEAIKRSDDGVEKKDEILRFIDSNLKKLK